MKHSEHYPTFIEHPADPEKRALVETPWRHHKQLLNWGLEGLSPVPPEPEGAATAARIQHDPIYPKWIENPRTHHRVLVPNAAAEEQQLTAWGLDQPPESAAAQPRTQWAGVQAKGDAGTTTFGPASTSASTTEKCRATRRGQNCVLDAGHAGNHQYKGA